MNKSISLSHSSMNMLDKISLHTAKQNKSNESIPLTPCPSLQDSEEEEMTPMELTVEDEENIPWCLTHCKRHFKVAFCLCFIAMVVLTVIVLTVYYHIHRKPMEDGKDEPGRSSYPTKWWYPTTDALPTIATSSTIPLTIATIQRIETTVQNSKPFELNFTSVSSTELTAKPLANPRLRYGLTENAPVTLSLPVQNFTEHQQFTSDKVDGLLTSKSDINATMNNNVSDVPITSDIHSSARDNASSTPQIAL